MATYNCSDSSSSAYGAGNYSTCASVGAPNTGVFNQIIDSASFTIIVPLAVAIAITVVGTLLARRRKNSEADS